MDEQQLKSLEEFSSLLFSLPELALLTGFDIPALYEAGGEVTEAVDRGRLLTEAKIRQGIIAHAVSGSPTAQEQALKLVKQYKIKEA